MLNAEFIIFNIAVTLKMRERYGTSRGLDVLWLVAAAGPTVPFITFLTTVSANFFQFFDLEVDEAVDLNHFQQ